MMRAALALACIIVAGCGGDLFRLEVGQEMSDAGAVDELADARSRADQMAPMWDTGRPDAGKEPDAADEKMPIADGFGGVPRPDRDLDGGPDMAEASPPQNGDSAVDVLAPSDAKTPPSEGAVDGGSRWPGPGQKNTCATASDCSSYCSSSGGSTVCSLGATCACAFPTETIALDVCDRECKRAGWSGAEVSSSDRVVCWCVERE